MLVLLLLLMMMIEIGSKLSARYVIEVSMSPWRWGVGRRGRKGSFLGGDNECNERLDRAFVGRSVMERTKMAHRPVVVVCKGIGIGKALMYWLRSVGRSVSIPVLGLWPTRLKGSSLWESGGLTVRGDSTFSVCYFFHRWQY